jgi:hypothetical protein
MRLFSVAFAFSAFLTAASAFAQTGEPLTSGSQTVPQIQPGSARFQESLSHQIRVERAREDRAYRQSLLRYYDTIGYDYAHPVMNSGTFSIPMAPHSRYIWRRGVVVAPMGFY